MRTQNQRAVEALTHACRTPEWLHQWIFIYCKLHIPRKAICPGHDAPFDYLWTAYHEPARDLAIWAPRGGGKTRLAAIATLLDLLHKPGCAVRILGGSLDQSLRMWEHLIPELQRTAGHLLESPPARSRPITLTNGSNVAVLTQSQRAVRGLRVQKLRCDEVEMFDPKVWEAAQLVTRSKQSQRKSGRPGSHRPSPFGISGAIEAISTLHRPGGLMQRVVDRGAEHGSPKVIRWCLMEVLERCAPERDCNTCPLWEECRGRAKTECEGFVSIDDAINMKTRVSKETWAAEMLCNRPVVQGSVFPSFDPAVHVQEFDGNGFAGGGLCSGGNETGRTLSLAIDFGFANPFACLWIIIEPDRTVRVLDEYVQESRTVSEHLDVIESRPWGKARSIACDPSGAGRNDQTAMSNIKLLQRAGYQVMHQKSLIQEGLELIRAALRPASGPVRLFIHPRCKRLILAMQAYRYPSTGSELPLKDGEHDHPIDALRYHFVNATEKAKARWRRF